MPSASSVPPKLCFQLLKDKDARKKLQDYGLSTLGDRVVRLQNPLKNTASSVFHCTHHAIVSLPQSYQYAGFGEAVSSIPAVRPTSA